MNMISADFSEDLDRIKSVLKDKAENAKNIDMHKKQIMYPMQ